MASYVTNFDFTAHPSALWPNGHAERVGNHWFQNDYSDTSQTIQIKDGVLSFETDVDDEAIILALDSDEFADRSYFIRTTLQVPRWEGFMYTGILAHADVGGTAHPETEGVALGLMCQEGEWRLKCKQWTDGDIYGYLQEPVSLEIAPDKWYTLQLEVKPRGDSDTRFSGRIWECRHQDRPTVADTGKLMDGFDDLWNPETGEWDNSDPPQWNPRLHNAGLFQWYGCPIRFSSFGIGSKESDFQRPLVYAECPFALAGERISFRASQMSEADSFAWDFGDGSSSEEPHPQKVYESPGEFAVTLTTQNAEGEAVSEPTSVTVLPGDGADGCCDDFAAGTQGWHYAPKGLCGTPDSECDPLYSKGTHDPSIAGGALKIDVFNHSPGSPAQIGAEYVLENWDLRTVSGQWQRPLYLKEASRLTVTFACELTSRNLSDTDRFALLVMDNDVAVRTIELNGSHDRLSSEETISFDADPGVRRIGFGLWCDTLSTKPVRLDASVANGPVDDTPRRCNLVTHRWDHWDDNGRVTAWLTRARITIGAAS